MNENLGNRISGVNENPVEHGNHRRMPCWQWQPGWNPLRQSDFQRPKYRILYRQFTRGRLAGSCWIDNFVRGVVAGRFWIGCLILIGQKWVLSHDLSFLSKNGSGYQGTPMSMFKHVFDCSDFSIRFGWSSPNLISDSTIGIGYAGGGRVADLVADAD